MRDHVDRNYSGDRLRPLMRYLRKQVGRPWDKVHSELARGFDRRSLRGFHLHDHVRLIVHRHVVRMPDGGWAQADDRRRSLWPGELFVDGHGLLRVVREREGTRWTSTRRSERQALARNEARAWRRIRDDTGYVRSGGCWWLVTWLTDREQIEAAHRRGVKALVLRRGRDEFDLATADPDPHAPHARIPARAAVGSRQLVLVPATKRQLGRREVRRLGLA